MAEQTRTFLPTLTFRQVIWLFPVAFTMHVAEDKLSSEKIYERKE